MKYFLLLLPLSLFAADFEVCTVNQGKNKNEMHCTAERNLPKARQELREKGQKERTRPLTLRERTELKNH